jgi:aquaporin Z
MILQLVAEFIATWALVLSMHSTSNWLAVGATLAVIILLIGPVSGGYANPAITLSMYLDSKIPMMTALAYVTAQLFGAVSAFYTYKALA